MDGAPVVVTVDLNACEGEPDPGRPVLARVRVPLQEPLPDGLRARTEMDAIGRLEGRLSARLQDAVDGRLVGSLCTGGAMVFTYYAADAPGDLGGGWEPYELEVTQQADAGWRFVREFLAPNDWQRVLVSHVRVIYTLHQQGDDGERPRRVEHTAVFPTPSARQDAGAALSDQGFEVSSPDGDEGGFLLRFARTEAVAGPFADAVIRPVFETVVAHGGRYDGWTAEVLPQ
jgi:hypothetical protein